MHVTRLSTQEKPRGLARKALWIGLPLALVAFAAYAWHAAEQGDRVARLSTLLNLGQLLKTHAIKEGTYPLQIADVTSRIDDEYFWKRVDLESITYVAGGKSYDPYASDERLFYENRARRYGFTEGWFEIYQAGWRFHTGHTSASSKLR